MTKISLSIPFTVPILGEAFTSVGNPLLTAALDFPVSVTVIVEESAALDMPIRSKQIRRIVGRYLESHGVSGRFSIQLPMLGQSDCDYLSAAALLFLSSIEDVETDAPSLLSRTTDDKTFITLSRAMTALSGGFVVSRRGEGLISLEGGIDATANIKRLPGRVGIQRRIARFAGSFPDLASPLWHLLGHLVLKGCDAIRERDAATFGRLMTLENSLAHSVGLIGLSDLRKAEQLQPSLGGKTICSGAFMGALILAPDEILPFPPYDRFKFSSEGVKAVGSS